MAAFTFKPLQVAKRKFQSYTSVPAQDHEDDSYDLEKRYSGDDGDYTSTPSSAYSSRQSSGAQQPMVRRHSIARPTINAYSYRNPRAFSRYFSLALGSTIILFILFLTKMGWSSAKSVELGLLKSPPPPPVWESFPFLKRYHGGIRTLVSREQNVPEWPRKGDEVPDALASATAGKDQKEKKNLERRLEGGGVPPGDKFNPYPMYSSGEYLDEYGVVQDCYLDEEETIKIPSVRAYRGVPKGMPDNLMGSYDVLGLRNDVCFERFGRLGPYGLGYSRKFGGTGAGMEGDREGAEKVWEENPEVDFRNVNWAQVQNRCLEKNHFRFKAKPKGKNHFYQAMAIGGPDDEPPSATSAEVHELGGYLHKRYDNLTVSPPKPPTHQNLLPRTVVLIRTWWDYNYDDEDLMFLRALISELSIQSGGEYTLHFLIHVKDDNKQIWADDAIYQEVLDNALPAEFRGMGTLWSERQMGLIYGGLEESFYRNLPVHGAYRSTFMPVQYFSHQHPEFDFIWHWEMDIRYTGHFYHLFDKVSSWARKQPRKGLWERNSRFYIPSEHGSWEDFTHMVRVQTEHGTNSPANKYSEHPTPHNPNTPSEPARPEKPIWGPEPPLDDALELDESLKPQTSYKDDNYTWGVGEDADLITFNPLFDPAGTNWILAEDVTGYNTTRALPPRRTAIITASRLSRRLLMTMHRETTLNRHTAFSEMWPGTISLHHGLKAVYAPHPVYMDRAWPPSYLAAIFNGGRNGAAGGARMSVFSDERQHNFRGSTWYYDAGFAGNLWKRWLGYKVDNDGGEEEERAGEGRMCLPGVLVHPVKQVNLVFEHED
ncbi:hypothetical protein K432DRAFT_382590 [Lepidopterella palustris CBS 459.81]|uniref:Major facilitator superfamily transporter n=1 Tax=Lepidopterella palustris CBS 459.81 TaxID=1314670 RepID=A0A8E2JEX1_9PEZI|nr:hypothetical protein K432DRAFT_382590 [Lepidopterella palustris CBS 459.81]